MCRRRQPSKAQQAKGQADFIKWCGIIFFVPYILLAIALSIFSGGETTGICTTIGLIIGLPVGLCWAYCESESDRLRG